MSINTNTLVPRNHEFPSVVMDGQSSAHFGDVYHLAQGGPSQEQQAGLKRNELLTALAFQAMNARHIQLAQTSVESLEWIWHKKEDKGPGFVEWLISEGTTFWITGKPASGKSTLMNFLASSNDCENILQKHSGHNWLLLDFYFDFRAGSQIANSLEGLLRSLLFQFAQKNSAAAKVIQEDPVGRDLHIKHNDMDAIALCRLIKIAAMAISDTHRILALIDGLDEYSGGYLHLIRMTERLVSNGIDKICLASRPEHLLHQFLVGKPHFRMQDYNKETIKAYVTHAIEQVSTMVELSVSTESLIDDVVHLSNGVVLWTRIATDTLLDSLLGGDTVEELWEKLREFPTELNEAYGRLLSGISGPKSLETALILYLIRTAPHPLSPRDLHCMLVFLRDTDQLPSWPRQTIDDATFLLRLRARTGSMVDIVHEDLEESDYPAIRHMFSSRVVLFHKTLQDYLTTSGWINDVLSTASPPIQPDQLWLRSFAQCVLKYDIPQESVSRLWDWFKPLNPEIWCLPTLAKVGSDPPFKDEATLKLARILSLSDSVESGMDFLNCAIANLPFLPEKYLVSTIPPEQNHTRQALGSPSMLLHVVMDRYRDTRGVSHLCECSSWSNCQSFYSKETLFMLSSRQRAILFAMLHTSFHTACSWLSEEESIPDRDFGQQILKIATFVHHLQGFSRVMKQALPLVARYADDEIVAPLMSKMFSGFDEELLAAFAPYLAVNSGDRRLTKAWSAGHELNSIISEGYNLYLPWSTVMQNNWFDHWEVREARIKRLEVIVTSGLDVNAVCCMFGPPLHTVIEVCLVLECRRHRNNPAVDRVVEQLNALRNVGADILVSFEGLTAQDLARKRLQEVEADTYLPVTPEVLNDFSKTTAIVLLQKVIGYLEVDGRVGGDIN